MTTTLNPNQRFDTMVVGAANRLAVTAAKAVAESPGAVYNPLFVYARPGLGKTHLLMAAAHAALAINPQLTAQYLTLDDFVETFHAAIAAGQGEVYRRRFLELDLLLVDDVQFLTHRREMQAELLRLIDALQTSNRQVVLTSDRPPSEIEALDERLLRRFAGGLVIDISAPDYETRVAILRRKAEERQSPFASGVLEAVATVGIDNVRELIGALNRLVAFQAVSDAPLDAAQARVLVGGAPELAAPLAPTASAAPAETPAEAPAPPGAPPPGPAPTQLLTSASLRPDEFSDFLSDVTATLADQVGTWGCDPDVPSLPWDDNGLDTDPVEFLAGEVASPERERESVLGEYAAALSSLPVTDAIAEPLRQEMQPLPSASPLWQLKDFAEGPGNRMAVRAAYAVTSDPGRKYNPLVIIGAHGRGKTHLLHGIGNGLADLGVSDVACLAADEFVADLIEAIDQDEVAAWRARYRTAGALLLDDVPDIAGKDRTQEELFLLFNLFFESGRQMVFTSTAPLAELSGVESRLRTRLEGGLVVELPAPDHELRQRVARRMLAATPGGADAELVAYLAGQPAHSVRTVQALIQQVLDAANARETAPTATLAREILEGAAAPARPRTAPRAAPPSSGAAAPTAGAIKSPEKMVWDWPDVRDRIIEEWR